MKTLWLVLLLAIGLGATACAQLARQAEPAPPVVPEPTYDKYGNPVAVTPDIPDIPSGNTAPLPPIDDEALGD